MAYIEWEDSEGTGVLTPSYPAGPARRFQGWTPDVKPIGPHKVALGTGIRDQFAFRRDYLASFAVPGLAPSQLALYLRFRVYALSGCPFFVVCEDTDTSIYECRLAPDTEPELAMSDSAMLEYTMRLTVKNTAAEPLLCNYRMTP